MNRSFGKRSKKVLYTLDSRLCDLVSRLLLYMDVSLLSGHRGKTEQNGLYIQGKSKLKWPESKHNSVPSLAVDLQPYPRPQNENDLRASLGFMAGLLTVIAQEQGIAIRWGGDWDMDGDFTDNGFDDLFHIELIG